MTSKDNINHETKSDYPSYIPEKKVNLPAISESYTPSEESSLYKYLKEINNIANLSEEEEFLLAKHYAEKQDVEAAQKLVASHLKLVAKIAIKYKNYGLPITDLISEGNIGLMQAVKKYNPNLGYRLSTYAMWWIKAAIKEYLLRSWSLVKIGTTTAQKKIFFSLNKLKAKISNIKNDAISDADYKILAEQMNVSEKEVREMDVRINMHDSSLNKTISDDNNVEAIDLLSNKEETQEIKLINKEDHAIKHKLLQEAINILNEREKYIFINRKLNDNTQTLDDLSKKYSISKERVRQIENKAFEKIQKYILENSDKINSKLLK